MHVNEQGKQPVQPHVFWIAVLGVTLVLGGVGLYQMQTGHIPSVPRWLSAVAVMCLWTKFLLEARRHGREACSLRGIIFLLGFTLLMGSDLVPHLGRATEWAKNAGALMMVGGMLPEWFGFGKRMPPKPSSPGLT
jgi:hypothetical protein